MIRALDGRCGALCGPVWRVAPRLRNASNKKLVSQTKLPLSSQAMWPVTPHLEESSYTKIFWLSSTAADVTVSSSYLSYPTRRFLSGKHGASLAYRDYFAMRFCFSVSQSATAFLSTVEQQIITGTGCADAVG